MREGVAGGRGVTLTRRDLDDDDDAAAAAAADDDDDDADAKLSMNSGSGGSVPVHSAWRLLAKLYATCGV